MIELSLRARRKPKSKKMFKIARGELNSDKVMMKIRGRNNLAVLVVFLAATNSCCRVQAGLDWSINFQVAREYEYDKERVESRIQLRCWVPSKPEELSGLSMCQSRSRWPKTAQKITEMTWSGDHAELQGKQFRSYYYGGYYWEQQYEDGTTTCISSDKDRYCRLALVCEMKEQLYGWLKNAPSKLSQGPQLLSKDNVKGYNDLQDLNVDKCIDCQMAPCDDYSCPRGKVNGVLLETKAGKVIRKPECSVACAVGTFLTCTKSDECSYLPVTDVQAGMERANRLSGSMDWYRKNTVVMKTEVNVLNPETKAPPPVEQCYPCRFAADLTHYNEVASTDSDLRDEGYLRFHCPGGVQAPVRCNLYQVTRFNATTNENSACGCKPGYYMNENNGACEKCPPGFFCAWNGMTPPVKTQCPSDRYSTGGAVECTRCAMDNRCEDGEALTRCKQSSQEEGKFQKENAYCVPCERCEQLQGERPASDAVPCYRVSPKVF